MPTKRDISPISPALEFFVLTGEQPSARVPGWVSLAQMSDQDRERHARAVWPEHSAILTRMAAAAGFIPWIVTSKKPRGPAVDAWREAFNANNRY